MNLYLTYCSARKREGIHAPDKLYISDRVSSFIDRCRIVGADWAIFSALYGLVFPEEKKRDYNVTFRTNREYWLGIVVIRDNGKLSQQESKAHISQLGQKLREQCEEHMVDRIVFYGPSPKMMKCYLSILHYAFDDCLKPHGWLDLIEHVTHQSRTLEVVHRLSLISRP